MSKESILVIGLGKTGMSVVRYLNTQGDLFKVIDTRIRPPELESFEKQFPAIPIHVGGLKKEWVKQANQIILSPGLDPALLSLKAINPRVSIYSDIDIFNQVAKAPIIAVTGSNGKSTVAMLIAHLLTTSSKDIQIGGNFGIPALELLSKPVPDFYILELSSFQLEITQHLNLHIAIFLNLTETHLDRHHNLNNYKVIKQKIYQWCKIAIFNREDWATYPTFPVPIKKEFGRAVPIHSEELGLTRANNTTWLVKGSERLLNMQDLQLQGKHNWLNAVAALTVGQALDLPLTNMVKALPHFKGLEHRLEWVATQDGITWVNDSKATNVDATLAALYSFPLKRNLILIAGGIYQGGNIAKLRPLLSQHAKKVILMGRDYQKFKQVLYSNISVIVVTHLSEAVQIALNLAVQDDIVMLSPACASQDMFADYTARGNFFKKQVNILLSQSL